MQRFTDARTAATPDEIWFLEHPPVFTLGLNASRAHLLAPGEIPVVQIDRGGQVTYHGPGQLVVYPLIDLQRAGLGVRDFVTALERAVIALAADHHIAPRAGAAPPGSTSMARKLASVGVRVRRQGQLPRPGAQRRTGPGAVRAHQSLRLRRASDDAARRRSAAPPRWPRPRSGSSRTCSRPFGSRRNHFITARRLTAGLGRG